jgi:hypothetical protein
VHVEWDTEAALTQLGQLPFFIDFLKAAGLCDAFIADCPLEGRAPAPEPALLFGSCLAARLRRELFYSRRGNAFESNRGF